MSIIDELPEGFQPLAILGDIGGYLHVYSYLDDRNLTGILEMAIDSVENEEYDVKTTLLQ
jgi:hypothetical protein